MALQEPKHGLREGWVLELLKKRLGALRNVLSNSEDIWNFPDVREESYYYQDTLWWAEP